jgi:purine/pyrimidine-nucleoside phosphorylase
MSNPNTAQYDNVSIVCKANVYFDGKVVSHTLIFADGSKKTIGIIYPGTYEFNTGAPERMDISAGSCRVRLAGQAEWKTYHEDSFFEVPGKSSFEITVDEDIAEYVCSFLPE